jgi:hypothetical protein
MVLSEYCRFISSHIFSSHLGPSDLPFHSTLLLDKESVHTSVHNAREGAADSEPIVAVGEFFDSPLLKEISWIRPSFIA